MEAEGNRRNVPSRLTIFLVSSAVVLFIFFFIFSLNRGHIDIYLFDQLAIALLFFALFSLSIYLIIKLNKKTLGYSMFFALFFVDILSYNYKILPIWRYGDVNHFRSSFFDIYNNALGKELHEQKILFNHRFYVWDTIGSFLPDFSNLQPTIKGHFYAIPNHINTIFSYLGSVGNKAQYDLYRNLRMSENINHSLWDLMNVKYFCISEDTYNKNIQAINLCLEAMETNYVKNDVLKYLIIDKAFYPELIVGKGADLITFDISETPKELLLRIDYDNGTREFRLITGRETTIENKSRLSLKLSFSTKVTLSNIKEIIHGTPLKAKLTVQRLPIQVLMYVDSANSNFEVHENPVNILTPDQTSQIKLFKSIFPQVVDDNYFYEELEAYYGQLHPVSRVKKKYLINNTDAQERLFSPRRIVFYKTNDDMYRKLSDTFHAPLDIRNIAYINDRYKHIVSNYRCPADISSYQSIYDGQGYQVVIKNRNEKCHMLMASPYNPEWVSFSVSGEGERKYNNIIPALGGAASMILIEPSESAKIFVTYGFEKTKAYLSYSLIIIIFITFGTGAVYFIRRLRRR